MEMLSPTIFDLPLLAGQKLVNSKRGDSRSLLNAVAFALNCNIPPGDVLEGLWGAPERMAPVRRDIFNRLNNGERLSDILSVCPMSPHISSQIIDAVRRAEESGTLLQLLQNMIAHDSYKRLGIHNFFLGMSQSIYEFIIVFVMIFGAVMLLFPNFIKLCNELIPRNSYDPQTLLPQLMAGALILVISTFLAMIWLRPLCIHLPFFGKLIQGAALYNLSAAYHSYLTLGFDVVEATRMICANESSRWLKRRLTKALHAMENGRPWTEAWRDMNLNCRYAAWILYSSAARNNPAEGFATLHSMLALEFTVRNRLLIRLGEFFMTVISGVLVGTLCYNIFTCLTNILKAQMV